MEPLTIGDLTSNDELRREENCTNFTIRNVREELAGNKQFLCFGEVGISKAENEICFRPWLVEDDEFSPFCRIRIVFASLISCFDCCFLLGLELVE